MKNRRKDKWTGSRKEGETTTEGFMEWWMTGWMDEWMEGFMDGWMDRWMDVRMYKWMDEWIDGWMDGLMVWWIDGCMHACMHPCIHVYPRAAELAAGHRREKNCGLAAGKIAASRQPDRKKYAAKPPPKIRLKAAFLRDLNKNWQFLSRVHRITPLS